MVYENCPYEIKWPQLKDIRIYHDIPHSSKTPIGSLHINLNDPRGHGHHHSQVISCQLYVGFLGAAEATDGVNVFSGWWFQPIGYVVSWDTLLKKEANKKNHQFQLFQHISTLLIKLDGVMFKCFLKS